MIKQIMHSILVFCLGALFPAFCAFGGMKFTTWIFGRTDTDVMWLGLLFGGAAYIFIFLFFRKWVKELDEDLP